jgi:catechol 2,3-dioxygenase-like lactoylglutathione lyase family enzyme
LANDRSASRAAVNLTSLECALYCDGWYAVAFPSLAASFGNVIFAGQRMSHKSSRRRFIRSVAAAGAALGTVGAKPTAAQQMGRVRGFDHVALPMENTDAMVAFYKALGFDIAESPNGVSVYVGENMINFHRPTRWRDKTFTNRAPAAVPPCGDLCFVWEGTAESLKAMLDRAAAKIDLGPVPRGGGRRKTGSSVYVRDPDGNLLEFMIYG